MSSIRQEKNHYPFFDKEGRPWFPIGWACNIHALGLPDDPPARRGEWKNGNLEYLVKQGCEFYNCVYGIPFDNTLAYGEPLERPEKYHTDDYKTKRFLRYLKTLSDRSGSRFHLRAFLRLLSMRRDGSFRVRPSGTWEGIPENELEAVLGRAEDFNFEPNLEGWILSDEPFCGDAARRHGKRDFVSDQLKYVFFNLRQRGIKKPVYNVVRGTGNYDFDPCTEQHRFYLMNGLLGIGDYIMDDLYMIDYVNMWNEGEGPFLGYTKTRVRNAIKNLCSKVCHSPKIYNRPAFLLFSQGMKMDCINPITGDGSMTLEQLRYQNYCAWINGAMGCMFWELGKSDNLSFANANVIAMEADFLKDFLLEKYRDEYDDIVMTASGGADAQFIVRRDWDYKSTDKRSKVLIMACNNSCFKTDLKFVFPEGTVLDGSYPILPTYYDWERGMRCEGRELRFSLGAWEARAFEVLLEENKNVQ